MAYFIFENNNLLRIAANDDAKNDLNYSEHAVVETVSDSDFRKAQFEEQMISHNGSEVVYTDYDADMGRENTWPSMTEEQLKEYHKQVLSLINIYMDANNSSDSIYSSVVSYKNYLEGLDYSSLTYPIPTNWEKYCDDNSIPFLSPKQIP